MQANRDAKKAEREREEREAAKVLTAVCAAADSHDEMTGALASGAVAMSPATPGWMARMATLAGNAAARAGIV